MGKLEFFPMYYRYSRTLSFLTDKQFGKVVRIALGYAILKERTGFDVKVYDLEGEEEIAFNIIRKDIDDFMSRHRRK